MNSIASTLCNGVPSSPFCDDTHVFPIGYLFHTFNEFWISHDEPKLTVMDFEMKFKEFKAIVGKDLMMLRVVPLSVLQVGRKEDLEQQEASSDKIELQDTLRQRKPITMS